VLQLILEYARLATEDFTNRLVIAVVTEAENELVSLSLWIQRRFFTPPHSVNTKRSSYRDDDGLGRGVSDNNDGRPYQTQTSLFRRRSYWPMQRFANQNPRTSTSRICLSIIIMATCSFIRMDWIHIDVLRFH
jgi:hypothetical protein